MLIKNGTVVAEGRVSVADVQTSGGVIEKIGVGLVPREGERTIDAEGCYVLPGGVDAHTHFDLDTGTLRAADDFLTGTVAAACGGNTTIIDHMAFGPEGCNLLHQLKVYHGLARGKAVVDYSFHGVVQHVNDEVLADIEQLANEGITSLKFYMTYDLRLDDYNAFRVINRAKELGVLVAVHPENDGIIRRLREITPVDVAANHAKTRPEVSEAEAVHRVLALCKAAGDAPVYVVHISSGAALAAIGFARESGQKNIYAETCPQYLFLDESLYHQPDGLKYIMCPPLRRKDNNELLWRGIENGAVDVVGTDHCPFNFIGEKQLGAEDYRKTPNGTSGVECRMPLLFSEGVLKNRISLGRFAEITAENPAKIFGLYPKKGVIRPGSDADIVIMREERRIITKELLHENVDHTPYEGVEVAAWPVMTISRGEVIAENGSFLGEIGRGQFLARNPLIVPRSFQKP